MLEAHVLSIVALGVSSFIVAAIPLKLTNVRPNDIFLTFLLCCGAGVLLATSLVHMLAEVQEIEGKNAELYLCCGFLLLYAVDEVVHLFLGADAHAAHGGHTDVEKSVLRESTTSHESDKSNSGLIEKSTSYGTLKKQLKKRSSLDFDYISYSSVAQHDFEKCDCGCCSQNKLRRRHTFHDFYYLRSNFQNSNGSGTLKKQPDQSAFSLHGLLIALLVHAFLEGTSIGVQTDSSKILLITGAIACHKLVLGLCLGFELVTIGFKGVKYFLIIAAFAVGCPLGVGFGVTLTGIGKYLLIVEAPLQGIAAGSLLFVAVFEVLPRERYKFQHKTVCRWIGLMQVSAVIIGFSVIAALNFILDLSHGHSNSPSNSTLLSTIEPESG